MADRNLPHVDVAGWLLGDLEPDEYDRTSRHLAACAACRVAVDDLRDTAEWVLGAGPDPEPAPGLPDRIVAAIQAEANPSPVTPPEGLTAADLTRTDLVPPDPRRTRPDRTVVAGPEATTADPTGQATADPRDSSRFTLPGPGDDRADDRADERETGPSIPAAPWPGVPTTRSTAADPAGAGDPDALDDDVPVAPTDTDRDWSSAPTASRPPGRDDGAGPRADRAPQDTPRWLRPVAAVAIAAVALVAFVLGANIGGGDAGDLELQAQLVAPTDDTSAAVTVRKLGSGRAVDVTSDTLPILPDGGIYELWFVGAGDSPDSPNRISAGTFHPDADGTTDVVLHAAVVPTDYPTVVITAEPNNGDPAVNGREVVRADG